MFSLNHRPVSPRAPRSDHPHSSPPRASVRRMRVCAHVCANPACSAVVQCHPSPDMLFLPSGPSLTLSPGLLRVAEWGPVQQQWAMTLSPSFRKHKCRANSAAEQRIARLACNRTSVIPELYTSHPRVLQRPAPAGWGRWTVLPWEDLLEMSEKGSDIL